MKCPPNAILQPHENKNPNLSLKSNPSTNADQVDCFYTYWDNLSPLNQTTWISKKRKKQ